MGLKDLTKKIFPDIVTDENYAGEIYTDEEQYDDAPAPVRAPEAYAQRGANVTVASGSSIEMKVVTPKSFDTVTQIADLLLSKKTVLLNLENTNRETARRLIDFLSGVAYALGGGVEKVADNTYAITPSNVAVSKENVGSSPAEADTNEAGISF